MAAPTSPADLSATVASNGPDGATEQVSVLDDYIRGLSGAVKQLVVKGADIPSAATITPAATASFYDITGTTGITAIGSTNSWDGRIVWFQFDDAVTLTHSSTLKLPGAVNYTTAAGDVLAFVQETSGTWRCVSLERASGNAIGELYASKSSDTSRTSTTTLANDPDLAIAVPSTGFYEVYGFLVIEGSTAGIGYNVNYSGTVGGSSRLNFIRNEGGSTLTSGDSIKSAVTTPGLGSATVSNFDSVNFIGTLEASTTGTIAVAWAQNSSSVTATILAAGSYLRIRKL